MPAPTSARADPRVEILGRLFQLLADTTRLRILELLLTSERNVGELVEALGIQQGRVSSHLACLKWSGFIAARRDGKFIYYRVTDDRLRDLTNIARGRWRTTPERRQAACG